MKKLLLLIFVLLSSSAVAADNSWITEHFAGLPVYTGTFAGPKTVIYPSIVKDATLTGGYFGFDVWECNLNVWDPAQNKYVCDKPPNYDDQRIAFMNVNINHQVPNGTYGSPILTEGDSNGWNNKMDVFISNVTIAPYWPEFIDYAHSNNDGATMNAGWPFPWPNGPGGHVYAENWMIKCPVAAGQPPAPCWSDAAIDQKQEQVQLVNALFDGSGINTLKLWQSGTDSGLNGHYIVNSTINNPRWLTQDPPQSVGGDGGLVSTWDCSRLKINVWNSTFNGSPTIPRNKIACWGVGGDPQIVYLDHDPTKTGEMHPMFGTAPPPPPPDQILAVIFPTGSITLGSDAWSFDQTNSSSGNYAILKNGAQAAGGSGNYLLNHLGTIYANTVGYGWWKWTGSAWVQSADPR